MGGVHPVHLYPAPGGVNLDPSCITFMSGNLDNHRNR